jgi:hypothetical protein
MPTTLTILKNQTSNHLNSELTLEWLAHKNIQRVLISDTSSSPVTMMTATALAAITVTQHYDNQ